MAARSSGSGEAESYVKQWQLNNALNEIDNIKQDIAELRSDMKAQATVHNTQITSLDGTRAKLSDLTSLEERLNKTVENLGKVVDLTYGPMKKNLDKLGWAVVGIAVTILGQLIMNFLQR